MAYNIRVANMGIINISDWLNLFYTGLDRIGQFTALTFVVDYKSEVFRENDSWVYPKGPDFAALFFTLKNVLEL